MRSFKHQFWVLISVYFLIAFQASMAQQGKALVTDIRHVQKAASVDDQGMQNISFNVDLRNFFEEDDEFRNMVIGTIEEQVSLKFNVSEVLFQEGNDIKFAIYGKAGRLNIKDIIPGTADIFVSVTSTAGMKIIVGNNVTYNMSTQILVKNSKGKNIFKQKASQDFISVKGDYLVDEDIIGYEDFMKLYQKGLIAVFSSEKIEFELQSFLQPVSRVYSEFVAASEEVTLTINYKQYLYVGEDGIEDTVLSYKKLIGGGYEGAKTKVKIKTRYTLTNHLLDSVYKVITEGSAGSWISDIIDNYKAPVVTFTSELDSETKYSFDNYKLEGSNGTLNSRVEWLRRIQLFEVFLDDTLVALIQRSSERNTYRREQGRLHLCYISRSLTSVERGELFNVLFAYVQAHDVHQQLISPPEE